MERGGGGGRGGDLGQAAAGALAVVLQAVASRPHNVGALVVLKSGDEKQLAGIVTERDFARKILLPGRPSEQTRVADIMTEEDKLITVTSNTNILRAMELMTDEHIRHVPVFDEKVVGMISVGDVVRAIVDQQHQEVKQLKKYITGDYY
uniref:Uncharacterized protein n=1 Tax=Avena sativa TaxID=4498 RepID=A0ACD5VF33_AVESA